MSEESSKARIVAGQRYPHLRRVFALIQVENEPVTPEGWLELAEHEMLHNSDFLRAHVKELIAYCKRHQNPAYIPPEPKRKT